MSLTPEQMDEIRTAVGSFKTCGHWADFHTMSNIAPTWLQHLLDTVEAQAELLRFEKVQSKGWKDEYIKTCDEVAQLRAEVAEASGWLEYWRREAFRKYPTPDAYDAACAALQKHRERADSAEAEVERLTAELLDQSRYFHRMANSYSAELKRLKQIAKDGLYGNPERGDLALRQIANS